MSSTHWTTVALMAVLISLPVSSFAEEHAGAASVAGESAAVSTDTSTAPESTVADDSIQTAPAATEPSAPEETIETLPVPEPSIPEAAPAAVPEPVAVPEPAPVTPPALKPITITFSGDLSSVNTTDTPPMIAVQDRYGVKKEISVPAEAKITQGTAAKALGDLKAGDKLTVEYTYDVATGKRTAQSISIGETAPANS